MTAQPRTAPGGITVEDFIHSYLLGDRHSAYPVEGPGGTIVGLITLAQLRMVAPEKRGITLVRDAAMSMDRVVTAIPHEPITVVLERLASHNGNRALVVDHGEVVGIVTASDVSRLIDVRGLDITRPPERVL
jgi:CBS domain-containing protein